MTTRRQGTKVGNAEADLEARLRVVEDKLRMVLARQVVRPARDDQVVTAVDQVAHGLTVGQVVYRAWDGSEYSWTLAWGFAGLGDGEPGEQRTGVFGVVSRVVNDDRFEVLTDGLVSSIDLADTGVIVAEDILTNDDVGLDLYLIDDVDNPGKVTRFRTASSIRIATYLPGQGYLVRVVRESTATFAVVDLSFSSLGSFPTSLPVVEDNGTDPVALVSYTDDPDPEDLRIAVCKYSETQSVVLRHGKMWNGGLSAGVSPAPTAGPRYLGTSGALVDGAGWLDVTPALHDPMLRCGFYDGARGFFFDPRHETSLQHSWDLKPGEGIGLTAALEDGDVPVWNESEKRFRTSRPFLATEADGPSVLARFESGVGPVVAFQVTVPWGVLVDNGAGELEWKLLTPDHLADFPAYSVLANETASPAPATHLEAPDGTVLARVGATMGFGSDPELGTAADGEGYFKIHFAPGKYFEFAADGSFKIYHSATLSMEVNASGKLTLTYANSNTVTIDPADIVGTSRAFRIRELDICDASGVAKKIQILATAAY